MKPGNPTGILRRRCQFLQDEILGDKRRIKLLA